MCLLVRSSMWVAPEPAEGDKYGGISVDPLIEAAGRALVAGDPLAALKLVALRNALRGIAMAQLGEFARAREFYGVPRSASVRTR